jgi:transposase
MKEDPTMPTQSIAPTRFIGLDIHKHYLVAVGVDADLHQVLGPQRVELLNLGKWMTRTLHLDDAVALEMTTNTWQLYDDLLPHVGSITVVHPPHVALITRAQVMNDKIAAAALARLLAKGLLVGIWVPPKEVQELRALIAQRTKMTRLATQSKNRLHALLHRHHILPPAGDLFHPERRDWWLGLELTPAEKTNLICNLDTLAFVQQQIQQIETTLKWLAARDERVTRLVHLPGISLINALAILGAIGTIDRFPSAKNLVGYSGLGGRVHDSGQITRTGRITKAGRKDLRTALVEAAQTATNTHPHWKAELARLQPRLGRNKAIIAIARKLLVVVWHVLAEEATDRFAEPVGVARKLLNYAYLLGKANRPAGQSGAQYVRQKMDDLGIGAELTTIHWGPSRPPIPLPPSRLAQSNGNRLSSEKSERRPKQENLANSR